MQFTKITAILLLITVGAQASDSRLGNYECPAFESCSRRRALRHVGFLNAPRAIELAKDAAAPKIAV